MFERLSLTDFKSFETASFPLAGFTLLVGANASGKSNVREAFRFLHGISRGYTLAEIVGEKWIEGGVRVWTGVRGGAAQIARSRQTTFQVEATFTVPGEQGRPPLVFDYGIAVEVRDDLTLKVVREHLRESGRYIFDTHPDDSPRGSTNSTIKARIRRLGGGHPPDDTFLDDRPVLGQFPSSTVATDTVKRTVRHANEFLSSMIFLDLNPHAARESSPAGIKTLGDRGENLSSVLAEICKNAGPREQLTSWIRSLTPLDAVDIRFAEDLNSRTLALLVESDGRETPLTSASDGTVRFLAMIAALLNPSRPRFIFFEELENGIHPNRVFLLLDLISQSVSAGRTQVLATSHSPQLLVHAYREEGAAPCLVFRNEGSGSKVRNIHDLPDLNHVLDTEDPASLMAAGWFEDVAAFIEDEGPAS